GLCCEELKIFCRHCSRPASQRLWGALLSLLDRFLILPSFGGSMVGDTIDIGNRGFQRRDLLHPCISSRSTTPAVRMSAYVGEERIISSRTSCRQGGQADTIRWYKDGRNFALFTITKPDCACGKVECVVLVFRFGGREVLYLSPRCKSASLVHFEYQRPGAKAKINLSACLKW